MKSFWVFDNNFFLIFILSLRYDMNKEIKEDDQAKATSLRVYLFTAITTSAVIIVPIAITPR